MAAAVLAVLTPVSGATGAVQADGSASGRALYQSIRGFTLSNASADLRDFVLTRDRVEMTLTGTVYFAAPTGGRVTGAVFVGQGLLRSEVPPGLFEQAQVRRMIGADVVESDFQTAVFRWTDDTHEVLQSAPAPAGDPGAGRTVGAVPERASRLAAEFEPRFTRETGINAAARLALSMLNGEAPGVFIAQVDGGRRDRFNVVLDHQNRIPVAGFGIDAGEKGLIFAYQQPIFSTEVWTAFYSAEDYARRTATLADANNLVDITHYQLAVDLTDPEHLAFDARIDMTASSGGVRAIPFRIGENLSTYQEARLENMIRLRSAAMNGEPIAWQQEEWEAGFTLFLPAPAAAGEKLSVALELDGEFLQTNDRVIRGAYYPRSNTAWLPRHGELDRATFDMTYRTRKGDTIASVGVRLEEGPAPDNPAHVVTTYRMADPVALTTFAIGPFERRRQEVTWDAGGDPIPLEFNAPPSRIYPVNHQFILAELDNAVRYFTAYFGQYPYKTFGAAFHPYNFGQGFPTLLMIPPTDRAEKNTFAFIAHETAHQWWGNIVAWRSYQDQWLSEGFAEYSAILYTAERDTLESAAELIRARRKDLLDPPRTLTGVGPGRLNDIGPLILGRRLNSTKTFGAYQALVYSKGALVLRMLHFLMSDPASGNSSAFVAMMSDFVSRHRNGAASTQNFAQVSSEHFARTPIARKYGLRDLGWFFNQWVFQDHLPSYALEYEVTDQEDGSVLLEGVVRQTNAPETWFMALPVVLTFDDDQVARTTVAAKGAETPVQLKLPSRPRRVELDPDNWILSEKTTTRRR
jgi:hypothetical protein